ncbi:MAG: hypothetical protein GQ468_04700 [Candidatus Scalindua sp.]|nr:hypothetical protein [Candidatus Scalindua sp.]
MDDNKKKSRIGFWISTSMAIFFFLCCVVLFISLMGLFVVKGALTTQAEDESTKKLAETVIGGTGADKILIIPLKGVITGQSTKKLFQDAPSIVESIKQQLEQAQDDNDVKAVILEINSPGGGITASDIIYNEVLEFK